ncbi:hypothetical protein SLS56_003510 [Neofusicoccum ribis]|uniref:Uncharacterized protein n=1 Tax=Neofusicoccum ribis TaxID=45134 RepID=A0ABR3T0L4_9PEZI
MSNSSSAISSMLHPVMEIERLRSERTRLVNAVKVLHQQLSSRAPELYAPPPATADGDDPTAPPTTTTTKTPPPVPPAEKLTVNEIVELIELSQERKKHGGSANDPIHPLVVVRVVVV